MKFLALSILLAAALAAAAHAAQEPTWQDELSYEAALVYDCEVAFLSQLVEREADGKQIVMAKVHCADQRSFDAQRLDPFEPFNFSPCEDREKSNC